MDSLQQMGYIWGSISDAKRLFLLYFLHICIRAALEKAPFVHISFSAQQQLREELSFFSKE